MIGTVVVGTEELLNKRAEEANSLLEDNKELAMASLYSHIIHAWQENKDHKEQNGINRVLIESLRQYNGEYDPQDLAAITQEGGSRIFMNITGPKVREASAWIKDILLNEQTDLFMVTTSAIPELPAETEQGIRDKITQEFNEAAAPRDGATPKDTAVLLKETNEKKRDLQDAIADELKKEAEYEFRRLHLAIKDSLVEGGWEDALDEVIDDFCIFPVAVLKGPVVSKEPTLTWENGVAVSRDTYKFLNKRVSPFDIYPAPEATSPQEGNFIEYMKMSRSEVAALKTHEGYENIDKVLENESPGYSTLIDTNVDQARADEEDKDSGYEANKNVYHSLHFFGTAPVKLLREWGMDKPEIATLEETDEVEIEAIVIGSQVVKCRLNSDPLKRRPYYVASLRRKPGSFWGASIPQDMRDVQRMCNGAARALANNMGLASGPLAEVVIDRLADNYQLTEMKARDIIQTTTDPSGGSGRAVNFFTVPSNAQELLAVFEFFEAKADEVTMIPRYARQNQQVTGAAATATGLSMLFESGSKGIKNAVRYLDRGIIVPRVEAEFNYMMLKGEHKFTGDIVVIPKGTQSISIGGAQQIRRNEFLQVTSNPMDMEILGMEGRASILRKMADDLDLGGYTVPSRHELKQKEQAKAQQEQAPADNIQIAQMQLQGQMQMAQMSNQLKQMELQMKAQIAQSEQQIEMMKLQMKNQGKQQDNMVKIETKQMEVDAKAESDNKQVALSIQTGDKMN